MITHEGVIVKVTDARVLVKVDKQSACADCHARGACTAVDQNEIIVEVNTASESFEVGQQVILEAYTSMGLKAVMMAFVIPFILVVLTLSLSVIFLKSEIVSGLISLLVLIPYYLFLYLNRGKYKSKFNFKIRKAELPEHLQ